MMDGDATTARFDEVQARIGTATADSGRAPEDVRLIVVSKTFGGEEIMPLLDQGHRAFGENRVQEAQAKWPDLRARYAGVDLHLIGPLQSNKARDAVALFDCIHTVDRPKIAEALAAEMERQGRQLPVFVQVNTGEEPQKGGVAPAEADAFVASCRELGLDVVGLMCIPPVDENPAPHFALLENIARRNGLEQLSMGMSDDFATAISLGATHVRVGSAILGSRPPVAT
jgi:PLP dependent protein